MRLPRQIKNSLLPLLLLFAAQKVCAQLAPADDFFNGGAQAYISNNIPAALERTEDGLKLYPDDVKLKKLEELLKQQQQQNQQQQNQQQQNQQKQSQSQQNSNSQKNQAQQKQQQSSQQKSQDQKKSDEQKQNQAGQKNEDQQNQSGQQKSEGEKNQNENGQPVAGQMTPEEAKKLLDAQKGDEQVLQLKPPGRTENQSRTVKDW
jgi:Ca-activated chloride channel family protein